MPISDERLDAAARAIAKLEGWDTTAEDENLVDLHHNPRAVRWVALASATIKARPRRKPNAASE